MDGSDRGIEALPAPRREHPWARRIALAVAGIKSALIVVAALAMASLGGGSDPAGQAYLYGGFWLGGLYWLMVILPALLLLRRATGRRVGLAFALLILPDVLLALAAVSQ